MSKKRFILWKNVIFKLSKNYDSGKERGKGSCWIMTIIMMMSSQLLHDKFILCECRLPPLLPLPQPHVHRDLPVGPPRTHHIHHDAHDTVAHTLFKYLNPNT